MQPAASSGVSVSCCSNPPEALGKNPSPNLFQILSEQLSQPEIVASPVWGSGLGEVARWYVMLNSHHSVVLS